MDPSTLRLIAKALLLAFVVAIIVTLAGAYRTIRSERINTRMSIGLADGEHDVVISIPDGSYQVQFTAEPNVSPATIVPPNPVLPAHITTKIVRGTTSEFIVSPTSNEHISFRILPSDAFQPHHLYVSVHRNKPCTIYMNLAPGF